MVWTDEPLTANRIRRKAQHVTELQEAHHERSRFGNILVSVARTFTPYIYYYDSPTNTKVWTPGTYPIAGPRGWPPNVSPNNEFRNNHIEDIRARMIDDVFGEPDGGDNVPWVVFWDSDSGDLFQNIANVGILKAGGDNPWEDLTAEVVNVRNDHITGLRTACERVSWILLSDDGLGMFVEQRSKTIDWATPDADIDVAWSNALTAYAGSSWSGWTSPTYPQVQVKVVLSTSNAPTRYSYQITTTEIRVTCNFTVDITGGVVDWTCLPPLEADITCKGVWGTEIDPKAVDVGILIRCARTNQFTDLSPQTDPIPTLGSYAKIANVVDYFGTSGHDAEQFIFNTLHDFSDADLSLVRDEVPTPAAGTTDYRMEIAGPGADTWSTWWGAIIKPDWKWGG